MGKVSLFLQGLTRGSLRVDGERELVDNDDQDEDDGGQSGGQGDVPTVDGSPGQGLGHGAGGAVVDVVVLVGGGGINELAARTVNASLSVVLEGTDNPDVDKEGNDHRDQDESSEENSDDTGEGHADGEDELVADAVKEEGEEEHQKDEGSQQSNQNECLRSLGDVTELSAQSVVLEVGGADSSKVGDDGLHAIEVIIDLGRVNLC